MVVNYFGETCFRLQSGEPSLLVDPTSNRLKADVVLRTSFPMEGLATYGNSTSATEISFPGEYEMKGIEITGVPLPSESGGKVLKTAYYIKWEEITIAILPPLAKTPDGDLLEKLNQPDVLFVPVGESALSADALAKLVRQIEPALVVPSSAKPPHDFIKALGQKVEGQEKLVFKKKDLTEKRNKVVVLESKA